MRKPHFFKIYSRVGVNSRPHGQNDLAHGVEDAPDKILTKNFLDNYEGINVSDFKFSIPEKFNSKFYYNSVLSQVIHLDMYLKKLIKPNETLVVIGGDHFITFPSILFDIKKYGTDFGVIHFDSHGDINLFNSSPSRNLHGMYLRIIFDKFDLDTFDRLVPKKMSTDNLLFIGDLELEESESKFIKKNKIITISSDETTHSKDKSLKTVKSFINKFDHIHISFDVDVFKKEIVSATTTPSQKGFEKKEIFEMLNIIKKTKSITLDVAEVNPSKKGAMETIKIAQEIITTMLK